MKELFEQILHALERGENVVLCSILASSGSAPRGAGAKMAVFPDGTALGTIGGGAVERIAQQQALELFRTGASYCQAFCLAPNQVNDIGMICGGTVMVYFRFFDHCSPQDAALVRAILELLQSGQSRRAAGPAPDGQLHPAAYPKAYLMYLFCNVRRQGAQRPRQPCRQGLNGPVILVHLVSPSVSSLWLLASTVCGGGAFRTQKGPRSGSPLRGPLGLFCLC